MTNWNPEEGFSHYQDLLREVEKATLVQEALTQRDRTGIITTIRVRLGWWLVEVGNRIQAQPQICED